MLPKRESPRHKEAFEYYYRMPKRSYRRVAEKYKVTETAVAKWSKAFHWQQRIKQRDEKADRKTEEKVTDEIAEMNARHIKMFQFIQVKAIKAIEKEDFRDAGQAATATKTAVDGERIARGAPTEHVEHSGGVKVIFEDAVKDARGRRTRTKSSD